MRSTTLAFSLSATALLTPQVSVSASTTSHSLTTCQGETANLRCEAGHELSVTKATYGRTNVDTCAAGKTKSEYSNTNCGPTDEYAAQTLDVIQGICDKKASCSIVAEHDSFKQPNPCVGTFKYLIVDFECTEINKKADKNAETDKNAAPEEAFMYVESYTCNRYTAIHHEIATAGSPIYTDDTTYTLGDTAGLFTALENKDKTKTLKKQELKLIQTPLVDKASKESSLASFNCLSEAQYILAIPPGKQPTWLELHGWVLMKDATISVNHPGDDAFVFTCWTKMYTRELTSVIGPNDGSDDLMMFVLYKELSLGKRNSGVISNLGEAAPTVAKCRGYGDPHYNDFNAALVLNKDDKASSKWLPLLTAKDCAFQVQTWSKTHSTQIDKTAVRFDKDLWLFDHVKKEFFFKYTDPSSRSTITMDKDGTTNVIENIDMGLKVKMVVVDKAGIIGTFIELSSMYYQMNVNGICGVPNAHPFALKKKSNGEVCGHDAGVNRHIEEVRPENVLWDQSKTWSARMKNTETEESSYCLRHYCVDPSITVLQDELPIPTDLQCAPKLKKDEKEDIIVDVVTPEENASKTCPALNEACLSKSPEQIEKVLRDIFKVVEKQPWRNDCIMLGDYCTADMLPQISTEDPACNIVDVNEENVVAWKNGNDYATLDFALPKNVDGVPGCHATANTNEEGMQVNAQIPYGWSLVSDEPEHNDAMDNMLKEGYNFGTSCLETARDAPFPVNGFPDCGTNDLRLYSTSFYKCLSVKICPSRIMITRKTSLHPVAADAQPSRVGWDLDGVVTIGNRGFVGSDTTTLNDWVKGSMNSDQSVHSAIVKKMSEENNLVFNFARDVTSKKTYLCMQGGNTRDDKAASVQVTFKTSPDFPLYRAVMQETRDNHFDPILQGPSLTSNHYYHKVAAPHAMCVGPLDTTGNIDLEIIVTKSEGLDNIHFVGPVKGDTTKPLGKLYSKALTGDEVKVMIHPKVNTDGAFSDATCQAKPYTFEKVIGNLENDKGA